MEIPWCYGDSEGYWLGLTVLNKARNINIAKNHREAILTADKEAKVVMQISDYRAGWRCRIHNNETPYPINIWKYVLQHNSSSLKRVPLYVWESQHAKSSLLNMMYRSHTCMFIVCLRTIWGQEEKVLCKWMRITPGIPS